MDKKKIVFVFMILTTWSVTAEPNYCCADKRPIVKRLCSNGEVTWARNCNKTGAYLLPEGQYIQNKYDDNIKTKNRGEIIEKDRYCLGSIEDDTEKVAVVCFNKIEFEEDPNSNLLPVQICCLISITCLSLTIIVYILLPKLRDLQGKCIMTTIINLLFAYTALFVIQKTTDLNYIACVTLAASMYFAFLSAFFWMNIVAINIFRITMKLQFLSNNKYIFAIYNIYGWGGPLIFLTVAIICHSVPGDHIKPGWGMDTCWFSGFSHLIYFHIPIFVLMSMNILIFIAVGWKMCKNDINYSNSQQTTNIRIHKSRKYKCILYLKLFSIMGITWIFEPISMMFMNKGFYLWYITDYINALQGAIIFLLLVVFRKRVRRDLARRGGILCGKLPKEWALIPDEEMEELDDSADEQEEEPVHEYHAQLNQPF